MAGREATGEGEVIRIIPDTVAFAGMKPEDTLKLESRRTVMGGERTWRAEGPARYLPGFLHSQRLVGPCQPRVRISRNNRSSASSGPNVG
jgi:hypothetical protein